MIKCNKCFDKAIIYVKNGTKTLNFCVRCYEDYYNGQDLGVLDWGMIGQGKKEPIVAPHKQSKRTNKGKQKIRR